MTLNETLLNNATNIYDLTYAANDAAMNWLGAGILFVLLIILVAAFNNVLDGKRAFMSGMSVVSVFAVMFWILNLLALPIFTGLLILWLISIFVVIVFKD